MDTQHNKHYIACLYNSLYKCVYDNNFNYQWLHIVRNTILAITTLIYILIKD